jgi:site-specific recombinase XerD/ribosomal protein L40E
MAELSIRDIHHYDRRLKGGLSSLDSDTRLIPANREAIKKFLEYAQADGLSVPRQVRYIFVLRKLSKLLGKPFKQAKKDDMIKVVGKLAKEDTSYDTQRSEKECIKRFYKWLRDTEDEYPNEVRWIKTTRKNGHRMLPENLLTEEEVKKLAEFCQNPRDRALILLLYETGTRVGELLSLRIGDVQFDQFGAVMHVNGKTGPRRVRTIFSAKALSEWMNHHPSKEDPGCPLWTTFEKVGSIKPLDYYAFRKMLSDTAKRAGITKRTNPHSFRHARASNLANVLTEAQMKEYLGWVGDSRMAATYVHLSGRNIDNALLKLNGIKTEEEVNQEEHTLKIRECARCNEVNPPTNRFCSKCGSPLDVKTALEIQKEQESTDEIMNHLFEDPKFRRVLEQTLRTQQSSRDKGSVAS